MDLSIIIISWNTRQLLQDCIESIYEISGKINYEIFVVDNASSDGSADMVKSSFEKVILIENDSNMGFARANNVAFPLATGRYVLLLNSDTVVLPEALDLAVKFMDKNVDLGALTPRILNADGSTQHPCYIKEPSLYVEFYEAFELGEIFKLKRNDSIPAEDVVCEVAHACGCSLFFRKEALDKVGYLDERMIFSFEDADICIRIRKAGWRILYYPDSKVVHFGGASRSKHQNKAVNAMLQSKYVFYRKYHSSLFIFALALCLIGSALIKGLIKSTTLFSSSKRSVGIAYVKYYWSIILWHIKANKSKINKVC
jgi:GT2 family glycosyltransferase